jgi:hypothetical protein
MSRYIDADNYKKDLIQLGFLPALVVSVLDKQPTVDVVEVVRCKDCKFWDKEHIERHTYSSEDSTLADFAECERWSDWAKCRMLRFNDYCSCGERSENGT